MLEHVFYFKMEQVNLQGIFTVKKSHFCERTCAHKKHHERFACLRDSLEKFGNLNELTIEIL